jgi:hypothetical protein
LKTAGSARAKSGFALTDACALDEVRWARPRPARRGVGPRHARGFALRVALVPAFGRPRPASQRPATREASGRGASCSPKFAGAAVEHEAERGSRRAAKIGARVGLKWFRVAGAPSQQPRPGGGYRAFHAMCSLVSL